VHHLRKGRHRVTGTAQRRKQGADNGATIVVAPAAKSIGCAAGLDLTPAGPLSPLCSQVLRSSALAVLSVCLLVANAIGGIAGLLVSVSVFVPVFILVVLIFGVSACA
jgi:hypothetical protein